MLLNKVFCQEEARLSKPYQYLRAIESAYDSKYQCDKHFARYIHRNPFYKDSLTDWRHTKRHSLNELAEVVNLNTARVKKGSRAVKGNGRNCTVFDDLRFWAYNQDKKQFTYEQWQQRCYTQAVAYNAFENPLPPEELIGIARSVAKYTYYKEYNPADSFAEYVRKTHTSDIQAKRGAIGGKKSKRVPVSDSERTLEPWKELGISRRTYYRRKAAGKL